MLENLQNSFAGKWEFQIEMYFVCPQLFKIINYMKNILISKILGIPIGKLTF